MGETGQVAEVPSVDESRRHAVRTSIRNTGTFNVLLLVGACVPVLGHLGALSRLAVSGAVVAQVGAAVLCYRSVNRAAVTAGVERAARWFAAVSVACAMLVILTIGIWAVTGPLTAAAHP